MNVIFEEERMAKIQGEIGRDGIILDRLDCDNISIGGKQRFSGFYPPSFSHAQNEEKGDNSFKAFISFASQHEVLAKFLRDFIVNCFPSLNPFFISSDPSNIPAGTDWFGQIKDALSSIRILFVLASELSLSRQWVNFEIGAAWSRNIPIVFLCHDGLTPEMLPPPYVFRQGLLLSKDDPEKCLNKLMINIENALQIRAEPKFSIADLSAIFTLKLDSISKTKNAE